jgi:hypothetical protein
VEKESRSLPFDGLMRPGVEGLFLRAAALLVVLVLGALLVSGWPMALSIFLGGAVALVNFHWMRLAMDQVLLGRSEHSPGLLAAGFAGRLLLILGVLFAIIQLPFLSLFGALGGLAIFVAAGLFEAVLLLGRRQF